MFDDPATRRTVAKQIAKEALRGRDEDPLGELNNLDQMFFRSPRVNIQVPVIDPVECRRCLLFLADAIPGLIAEMDRVKEPRSKSLLAQSRLRAWSHSFTRAMKRASGR